MSDIAAKAGVSQSTVSFVLNNRHTAVRISEGTRRRVLAAAEELGYRANHMARAMRTGDTRMLGFIGGNLCTEQVGCMLAGALAEADQRGYTLKTLSHFEQEEGAQQIIRRSSELRLMGLVALHLPLPVLEQLHVEAHRYKYPLVLLDTRAALADLPHVVSDDERGVALAIEHLVKLGHRKIAMLSGEPASTLTALRESAYRAAMKQHGLPVADGYVAYGSFSFHAPSERAAQSLLQLPAKQRPTAVFCAGDLMALALLQVAAGLGLRVPDSVSVVGFANLSVAQFSIPALTTVGQPFAEMGQLAVRRVLASCAASQGAGDGYGADPVIQEVMNTPPAGLSEEVIRQGLMEMLPTRLIERASTMVAPH